MNKLQMWWLKQKQKFLSHITVQGRCSRSMSGCQAGIQASWQLCCLHKGVPALLLDGRRSRRQRPGLFPSVHCPPTHSPLAEAWSHGHSGCKRSWERQLYPSCSSATSLVVVPCYFKEVSPWPTLYKAPQRAFPGCCPAPLPSEAALPLIPEAQLISGCNVQQTATAEENDHVEQPC